MKYNANKGNTLDLLDFFMSIIYNTIRGSFMGRNYG